VAEAPDSLTIRQKWFLSTGDLKPEEDMMMWWILLGITLKEILTETKDNVKALTEKETNIFNINTDYYKLNTNQNRFYRVNYPLK